MRPLYYIIPKSVADELGTGKCRYGNDADGYLVNIGDLIVYGVERAAALGAREITVQEAKEFVNQNKK